MALFSPWIRAKKRPDVNDSDATKTPRHKAWIRLVLLQKKEELVIQDWR